MIQGTVAGQGELAFLGERERLATQDLRAVVERGQALVARDQDALVGWLRWGMFWDEVPFMNMLHVVEDRRHQGIGRRLVEEWQHRCRQSGHALVMTSTMSSESAQLNAQPDLTSRT
jgi:predicted N-acetyltransferase YhbS